MKNKKISSFFPDSWSKQRVQEELALAYRNRIVINGNKFYGEMSDGVKVQFYINNGVIDTAFPVF